MVDNLRDIRPGMICVAGDKGIFKVASVTAVRRDAPYGMIGIIKTDSVNLRTVPPGFTGGMLPISDYGSVEVHRLVSGSQEAYHRWLHGEDKWNGYQRAVDLSLIATGEGTPITQHISDEILNEHRFVKEDLMAYVVKVNGPQIRDDIMRSVAALEGMPWIPTSNTEYFSRFKDKHSTLFSKEKRGQKKIWTLGGPGHDRADRVLAVVGEGPALAAK